MNSEDKQVLVLGGGFVGLFAALSLRELECPLPIRLVDRNAHFVFKPLLYELLAEEVDLEQICPKYEDLLADKDISFVQADVESLDLLERQVQFATGGTPDSFQYLVLALGDQDSRDQVSGAAEHTFSFRSAQDVLRVREHLESMLQEALQTSDRAARTALLTVAIIGAGPEGVELAATLADLLPAWYEALGGDTAEIHLCLLHRGLEILPTIDRQLRTKALTALDNRRIAVDVQLDAVVDNVSPSSIHYTQQQQDRELSAATMLWAAGSKTHALIQQLSIDQTYKDERQRPYLTSALQLIQFPEVFAGGDCAVNVHTPQSATAQIAYQHGRAIAENIMCLIADQPLVPCDVTQQGTFLKVGQQKSLVDVFDTVMLSGKVGHLARRAVYLSLVPQPGKPLELHTQWIADEMLSQFNL